MNFTNPAGVASEAAEQYVNALLDLLAAHDLVHLRQIERIKESLA